MQVSVTVCRCKSHPGNKINLVLQLVMSVLIFVILLFSENRMIKGQLFQ